MPALTNETLKQNILKIRGAFPNLSADFYDVFIERVKSNKMDNDRLIKAVNYVIDNCAYPNPTIADFIMFDKKDAQSEAIYRPVQHDPIIFNT